MENEKIENLLNLALQATPTELDRSLELEEGFDRRERTWEVVVKYTGSVEVLREMLQNRFSSYFAQIQIINLSNEYTILILPESIVEQVAAQPEIEYMEKPKSLFFAVNQGKSVSCINSLQGTGGGAAANPSRRPLTGAGCLIALIDSGIDYAHPDFCKNDGTTRIWSLWDQSIASGTVPRPQGLAANGPADFLQAPSGFTLGTEFSPEVINLALEQPTEQQRFAVCPSRDISGHGTHVAGIAAGNGRASGGRYRGVAYESELIVVKLGNSPSSDFPRTTELMQAVDYCMEKAAEQGKPLAINLSFGNNYGSHSGSSLLETYLDDMANRGRVSIVVGSGNEGTSAGHTSGILTQGQESRIQIAVSNYESGMNLQIWKSYVDEVDISVVTPSGKVLGPIIRQQQAVRFASDETALLCYYGTPSPYSVYQEIYIDFLAEQDYIAPGLWEIRIYPRRIVEGSYDMWLPGGGVLNAGTGFLYPTEYTTLTIPSTAAKVITVGAYDGRFNQPAGFSGRGFTRVTNLVKPDLVAPGVEIVSCAPGGGYTSRTGTSMATPFVSGSAALLMQWGIVDGNDSYLYGEKLKAYFLRGARQLPVTEEWPNPQMGWGALCVEDSLPG